MKHQELISPLDNRYSKKIIDLANNFSESNLNKTRFEIEIDWIIFLTTRCGKNFKPLSSAAKITFWQSKKASMTNQQKESRPLNLKQIMMLKLLNILLERK